MQRYRRAHLSCLAGSFDNSHCYSKWQWGIGGRCSLADDVRRPRINAIFIRAIEHSIFPLLFALKLMHGWRAKDEVTDNPVLRVHQIQERAPKHESGSQRDSAARGAVPILPIESAPPLGRGRTYLLEG